MSRDPAWKTDFPISWADDDAVTRREFTKSLVWVSCASFLANAALAGRALYENVHAFPEQKVADRDELAVGQAKVFHYPEGGAPCLLIRVDDERFVAFGQKCTHLGCPVLYQQQSQRLYCPCHEGFFDATSGAVISGPPPRPLPAIALEVRGQELWAVGLRT